MTTTAVAPRVFYGLAVMLLVGAVALTALFAFAAQSSGPGESGDMFTLLAASTAASGLAALVGIAAGRAGGGGWPAAVVIGLLVVSLALLVAAATHDGGIAVLAIAPFLLMEWWVVRSLLPPRALGVGASS